MGAWFQLLSCGGEPTASDPAVAPDEREAYTKADDGRGRPPDLQPPIVERGGATCNALPMPYASCAANVAPQSCAPPLWPNGVIPYRFNLGSVPTYPVQRGRNRVRVDVTADMAMMQAGMRLWESVSRNAIRFEDCSADQCRNRRFLDIRWKLETTACSSSCTMGNIDGATCFLSVCGASVRRNNLPNYTANHELGHAIGFWHVFQRFDRDRFVKLTNANCAGSRAGQVAVKCQAEPVLDDQAPFLGNTFGPYDSSSVMGYGDSEVCSNDGQWPDNEPTQYDGSAVQELYYAQGRRGWSPFVSTGVEPSAIYERRNGELAPGVTIASAPAITSWGRDLTLYVRGSDSVVYTKSVTVGLLLVFQGWGAWTPLPNGWLTSDPAAVTRSLGNTEVVGVGLDGNVWDYRTTSSGQGAWFNLGAPRPGAASAPAIVSTTSGSFDVFVRGGDNKLWHASFSAPDTVTAPTVVTGWTRRGNDWDNIAGRPAAGARGSRIDVVVVAAGWTDGLWTTSRQNGTWSSYTKLDMGGAHLAKDTSPVVAATTSCDKLDLYAFEDNPAQPTAGNRLVHTWHTAAGWGWWQRLGGIATSPSTGGASPGAWMPPAFGDCRVSVAMVGPIVTSSADTDVWWRQWPYNSPLR